jgi:superfamily II DNA or RNA helicase
MQELQQQERLRVNDSVRVRRQRWRIRAVRSFDSCQLITLAGTGDLNHDSECRVVTPFERVERVEESQRLRPVRMRAWRRRCRALIADARPAGALQSALHARIDLVAYQLEPALAIMRGEGSRVLIADEVGLGKTIQAGLIIAELKAFGAADRVLLLVPAGLRDQWQSELGERFGIQAAIVDMSCARRRAATLPVGFNPWTTFPVAVTSVDYAKRQEVLPALLQCHWDLIVVDEAHGITPESDRHEAVFALTARASYVVLLTATPHNGDRAAFDALCNLGKASDEDPLLMFRRHRIDVAPGRARRVHRVDVRPSTAERRVYERLEQFSRALEVERQAEPGVALTLTMLHKRALSSARSLETSVRRRLAVLDSSAANPFVQLALPLDDGGECSAADEAPGWTWPSFQNAERERRLLESLADAAQQAALRETKLARLKRLLRHLHTRNESAIVFTEYRDTLAHVHRALAQPCAVIHGGLSRDERRAALDDFQRGRCAVLLATDAAGEGLNLHHTCRVVINLELPWNPMRLEQRIGRVDRIGQTRRVHAFNLIASEVGEERLFERLALRVASARSVVGASNPLCVESGERIERLSASEIGASDLSPPPAVPLARLLAEAERERQRLIDARRLSQDAGETAAAEISRPSIARARKPLTRAKLGENALVILRQACEDLAGQTVAVRLVSLLVPQPGCLSHWTKVDVEALLGSLGVEFECHQNAEWLAQTAHTIERFWRRRIAREGTIAHAAEASGISESQPGLFDRRVELAHVARLESDRERRESVERRLAVIARRAAVIPAVVRAALVLVS